MKTINILIALFISLFTISCNDNEYIAPDELTDVLWYTSIFPGNANKVLVGKTVSFMDLSVNPLSHEWTIEDGNCYLKTGFQPSWGTDTLKQFINDKISLINTDHTVHVLFLKEGQSKVRFRNTFSKPVTYKGTKPLKAVQEGNVWVIDTTLVFEVTLPAVTP